MNSPYCGWNKNSFNDSPLGDFDFLQLNKTQLRGEKGRETGDAPGSREENEFPESRELR